MGYHHLILVIGRSSLLIVMLLTIRINAIMDHCYQYYFCYCIVWII